MKAGSVVTILVFMFMLAMLFGSPPVDARGPVTAAATISKPLEASKLSLVFCSVNRCDYFMLLQPGLKPERVLPLDHEGAQGQLRRPLAQMLS